MSNDSGCGCGCSGNANDTLTIENAPTEANMNQNDITLQINGMTCGHCVSSVTEELSEVAGVSNVTIDLNVGGASVATVTTTAPVEASALEAAVAEAGYTLATSDA
ncbi:MAG: heavy-metal-associated domain-containing protein [Leucobacter sp.]